MPGSSAERRRGIRTLASGMLAAQVAAFIATPLLTRLYDPTAFGVYAFLLSVLAVGAPVAALRFDAALILPTQRNEAWLLWRIGVLAAATIALLLTLFAWLLQPQLLASGIVDEVAASLLLWLPALLLATGLFQLCSAWLVRERWHAAAARGRAAQGVITAAVQSALGFVLPIPVSLIVGDLSGRVGAVTALFSGIARPKDTPKPMEAIRLARRYRGFATLSSATALVNSLNGALPVLFVTSALGLQAAGLLLLAQRVASLPGSLLTTATSQVFAVDLARANTAADRVGIYWSTIRELLRYALPVFCIIALLSPFFGLVFGGAWQNAGAVTAAIVPFYAAQLLSGATIVAVDVMEAHRARLIRESLYLAGMLTVLTFSVRAGASLNWLAVIISAFGLVFYTASVFWISSRLRHERLS